MAHRICKYILLRFALYQLTTGNHGQDPGPGDPIDAQ